MKKILIAMWLALPLPALAEDDGEELLAQMEKPAAREVALAYIDNVRTEWDGTLFCIGATDPRAAAFNAVKAYLEAHPRELYRPRRYLIVQGLRDAYPCGSK